MDLTPGGAEGAPGGRGPGDRRARAALGVVTLALVAVALATDLPRVSKGSFWKLIAHLANSRPVFI